MVKTLEYQEYMDNDFPFKIQLRGTKGLKQPFHSHEYLQVCYVKKGSCIHHIHGKITTLVKGDMFVVLPFVEHAMDVTGHEELRIVMMDFMPFFINENMKDLNKVEGLFDFDYIEPMISLSKQPISKITLSSESQTALEYLMDDTMKELNNKLEGYKLAVKADLLKILVILGREIKDTLSEKNKVVYFHKKAFFDSIQYMEENYENEIRLEDVARMATMAPSYYSRLFKQVKSKTFIEYLNLIRITKAIKLLRETDMNVTQISQNVGYNNLGHFTRMFKSITGNTPTDYRKQV